MSKMSLISGGKRMPFDYSALPADVAADARAVVERFNSRAQAYVLDTGRDLLAIKDRLGHGHFGPWLEAEFGWSERTAQRWMGAAEHFGAKSDIVSVLPPTTVCMLAAPSTPAPAREEVVSRLERGERLRPTDVKMLVREAKAIEDKATKKAKAKDPEEKKRRERAEARRQREHERNRAKWAEEDRQRQTAAEEAARFLVDRLAPEEVRQLDRLLQGMNWHYFIGALREARPSRAAA